MKLLKSVSRNENQNDDRYELADAEENQLMHLHEIQIFLVDAALC